jgi:hypothetical protein
MTVYGTVDELKIRIQLNKVLSADETTMLTSILTAASAAIDRMCRRSEYGFQALSVAIAKYFVGKGNAFLRIPECVEVTEVAVKASVTATTYTAWTTPTTVMAGDGDWIPCTGNANYPVYGRLPYTLLLVDANSDYNYFLDSDAAPVIMVTARWGHSVDIPDDIREATLMQSARWYKRFQSSGARSTSDSNFGKLAYQRTLDTAVKQILLDGGWVVPLYGGP